MRKAPAFVLAMIAAALLFGCGDGGGDPASTTEAPSPTATPLEELELAPAGDLALPPGFSAQVIAEGLVNAATMVLAPNGDLYAGLSADGGIVRLRDLDGDGVYEEQRQFAEGFNFVNGLTFSPQGELYVSSSGRVSIARDRDGDGVAEDVELIVAGLTSIAHSNNGLVFGNDGKLYLTNGSTCNDCEPETDITATILQLNPDGSGMRVFARGTRNPYDLTFDNRGRLWATDNGSDPPCNTTDELNLIVDRGHYGWPYMPECDNLTDGTPPVASLGHNVASTGLVYYTATQFPAQFRNGFFITLWGSFPTAPEPAGRKLVHVTIDESGEAPRGIVRDFGTGFDHPVDVIIDRDGSLLVADWGSGRIYRITYEAP
jgi:putative membrane-bound dehydrogenase-like protein